MCSIAMKRQVSYVLLLVGLAVAFAYPRPDEHTDVGQPEVRDIETEPAQQAQTENVIKTYETDNAVEPKVSYSGAQLWKVAAEDNRKRIVLGRLKQNKEISTWGGNTSTLDILVRPDFRLHVAETLNGSDIDYQVIINDIQRAIDTENPTPSEEEEELASRKGHRMTWSAYHRLADIYGYLDYLAITYPSLCTVQTIGSSIQGRGIKLLKISNGKLGNKAVWIDGGIHAREWISPATVTYIINEFVENYDTESEDVKNLDWYIVPVANPDGYEYSHTNDRLWRKNRSKQGWCTGTDLNRNFGYRWGGKGSSKNPCTETYGGSSAFSELESQAIRNFITSSAADFKTYLSFHSYGQYILYPWGYDHVVPPDDQDLQSVGQKAAQEELKETKLVLVQNERALKNKNFSVHNELVDTVEELKDIKEHNTALQLQLDNLTKTHKELKNYCEELLVSKRNLEARLAEIDASFSRCKSELLSMKESNEKLTASEHCLRKQLDIERLQSKTAKLQTEKDAICILDLNRQVKEMERIIQRKYPDSMSGLLTATKSNPDANKTPRLILQNRIKELEAVRISEKSEYTTSYMEMKEKLAKMEEKYESHIQDLETHVIQLTDQMKSKKDTYDIYTQTYMEHVPKLTDNNIKEVYNRSSQTDLIKIPKTTVRKSERSTDSKEDAYLLATIRGLQTEIANKDKIIGKLQKEIEELRKSNRKLYKDREANIKRDNKSNDKQFIKTPDTPNSDNLDREVKILRDARDQLKTQLCKLEDDYQNLKTRRLQDLNTLQSAHERELMTYMSNIGPMREQLNVQQISINTLQSQLASCKEELAIITVERDHIDARLKNFTMVNVEQTSEDNTNQLSLQKKIAYLERRYEEREHRLRAIVHGLAQKQVAAKDCAQCAARQQQLIGYKTELDQLLATLRYLQ